MSSEILVSQEITESNAVALLSVCGFAEGQDAILASRILKLIQKLTESPHVCPFGYSAESLYRLLIAVTGESHLPWALARQWQSECMVLLPKILNRHSTLDDLLVMWGNWRVNRSHFQCAVLGPVLLIMIIHFMACADSRLMRLSLRPVFELLMYGNICTLREKLLSECARQVAGQE